MSLKPIFIFLTLILFLKIDSKMQIKFRKYNSLLSEFMERNIAFFVSYFIENIYSTQIYIGEPSQKIIGFLRPEQVGFYLINNNITCLSKSVYNYEKSNNFKLIEKESGKYYNIYHFSDSILIENITNSGNIKSKIDDFEIMSICELNQPLCLIFGTKLISYGEEVNDNFLYGLHKNNHIKSYYFSYDINTRNDDELTYIFDLDANETINGYTFIKTSSKTDGKKENLIWGLNFDKIYLDNDIFDEEQSKAEFDYNLGTLIGPSSFRDLFKKFLKKNEILEICIEYNKKYYIYTFEDSAYDKLKNFTIDFYHKEYDFHFILNYNDLFYEKFSKIYFLIVFNYQENNYWKFGLPFFKKFKFIYNYDSKTIGFFNNKNNDINENNNNNFFKSNSMIIIIIALVLILVLILIFIGILIGKKLYQSRKIRTNELPDLYEYNSINK